MTVKINQDLAIRREHMQFLLDHYKVPTSVSQWLTSENYRKTGKSDYSEKPEHVRDYILDAQHNGFYDASQLSYPERTLPPYLHTFADMRREFEDMREKARGDAYEVDEDKPNTLKFVPENIPFDRAWESANAFKSVFRNAFPKAEKEGGVAIEHRYGTYSGKPVIQSRDLDESIQLLSGGQLLDESYKRIRIVVPYLWKKKIMQRGLDTFKYQGRLAMTLDLQPRTDIDAKELQELSDQGIEVYSATVYQPVWKKPEKRYWGMRYHFRVWTNAWMMVKETASGEPVIGFGNNRYDAQRLIDGRQDAMIKSALIGDVA